MLFPYGLMAKVFKGWDDEFVSPFSLEKKWKFTAVHAESPTENYIEFYASNEKYCKNVVVFQAEKSEVATCQAYV